MVVCVARPSKTTPTVDHMLFAHVHAHSTGTNVYMAHVVYARSTGEGHVLYRALVRFCFGGKSTCIHVCMADFCSHFPRLVSVMVLGGGPIPFCPVLLPLEALISAITSYFLVSIHVYTQDNIC